MTANEPAANAEQATDRVSDDQQDSHDPLRFVSGLGAKLASRSRHVCLLLGSGSSKACGLPDVQTLQGLVGAKLTGEHQNQFQTQLKNRTLEQALSRIRRIAALDTGDQPFDGLTSEAARRLDTEVCRQIIVHLMPDKVDDSAFYQLAAWLGRARYSSPIEVFTVNYDLLLETALERRRVLYFDGFVGALRAHFHTELVENLPGSGAEACVPAFFVRLWKLHGSLNWLWDEGGQIVRVGEARADAPAAIYPSDAKYDDSRRVPFLVLQDRFRRALNQPETFVIISGYSFGDDHLNELIFDAAAHRERSEFVAFCYSEIPQKLAERATTTPNLQAVTGHEAILGGRRARWYRSDSLPSELWVDGKFALRDFGRLAQFLARDSAEPFTADLANASPSTPPVGSKAADG